MSTIAKKQYFNIQKGGYTTFVSKKCVYLQTKSRINIVLGMKQTEEHPLLKNAAEIEERGVVVIENVTALPAYGKPYVSPHLLVCLNHRGHVLAEYDMQQVDFGPHDVAMLLPGHVLTAFSSTDDYQATLLVFSESFLNWLLQEVTHMSFYEFHNISSYNFTDSQFESMKAYVKMLEAISQIDHPARMEMLASQISVGTRMCDLFLTENLKKSPTSISNKQKILSQFYNAIATHYRENREVKFYANLLCLSPKHFGTVIREFTGVGAGEWIARYVIIQAKTLLRQRPDLSIQQISDQIGFSGKTAFSRYFKTNTGMTPKEYRDKQ